MPILQNELPVVMVHGMFGFGSQELGPLSYWGSAFEVESSLERVEASVGPISSTHDRACELAAQLKGTRVDYGKLHATAHGHERFGRDHSGRAIIPVWDAQNPLHLVGHSLGASTICTLQELLAADYWGWGSTGAWITSITSLSGPLNGTTAVYLLGADTSSGLLRRGTGITPLLRLLELYDAFSDTTLSTFYDLDLDHWGYTPRPDESLESYLQRVCESPFLWGADNAFHSVSLHGARRDNLRWRTSPQTYYFSYVTSNTFRWRASGYHYPSPLMHATLSPFAWRLGRMDLPRSLGFVLSASASDWWENDGLVPSYSQVYPRHGGHDFAGLIAEYTPASSFLPGRWHAQWERGFDHADIVSAPRWWLKKGQRRFYKNLFARLAALTPAQAP